MVSTRHHPREFPPPSTPSPSTSKRASNGWFHTPSTIVTLWLLISSLVVLWDAGFIFCRPHSLPGGSLHFIWAPYAMYSTVDYLYGWPGYNSKNGFVAAQSAVNILESIMYLFYLTVVFRNGTSIGPRGGSKKTKKSVLWFLFAEKSVDGRSGMIALLLVFTTCVMTLSKTTLYSKLRSLKSILMTGKIAQ